MPVAADAALAASSSAAAVPRDKKEQRGSRALVKKKYS